MQKDSWVPIEFDDESRSVLESMSVAKDRLQLTATFSTDTAIVVHSGVLLVEIIHTILNVLRVLPLRA